MARADAHTEAKIKEVVAPRNGWKKFLPSDD
jgi:hypothetical protein